MKNKNFRIALLLFGLMSGLSIILCLVAGNDNPFIEFISIILICSPPILYISGIFKLISSMIEKETNIIVSILLGILATILFSLFYGFACFVILIG